jgi:hypothetical protein
MSPAHEVYSAIDFLSSGWTEDLYSMLRERLRRSERLKILQGGLFLSEQHADLVGREMIEILHQSIDLAVFFQL